MRWMELPRILLRNFYSKTEPQKAGEQEDGGRGCQESYLLRILIVRFFHCLDWASVYHKQLTPPIVQNVKSENDTRNFNNYNECEVNTIETVSVEEIKLFDEF